MKELEDTTVLITGASKGIGKSTAIKFAENNANIVLSSRSEEELTEISENIEEKYDSETLIAPTDVTNENEVKELFKKTVEKFGQIDVVVANAGLGVGGSVEEMNSENFHKMMDVNCDGVFYTSREAIPHLRETDGNLILLASFAGKYPRPSNPVYAATKWWVRGFGQSLLGQIGDDNIGVTLINPTEVRTKFASESGTSFEERFDKGEVSEPEDIAEAIRFAARQEKPNTVNELDLFRRDKFKDF